MNKRWIIINFILIAAIVGSWLIFMGDFRQKTPSPETPADIQQAPSHQEAEEPLPSFSETTELQTEIIYTETDKPITEESQVPVTEDTTPEQLLRDFSQNQKGDWSIVLETMDGKIRAEVNGDASMVSASLIKLFIMAATYEQIELGALVHEDVITLIEPMITISDNSATNRLIEILGNGDAQQGMELVNDFATRLGCEQTKLCRLMLADNGLQNYTSAADCALLLRSIYEQTCINEAWSREMLEILKKQTIDTRIPEGLPEGVVCGNKTGDLTGLCCADVGIVFTPESDYILCLICNNQNSDSVTTFAMAALSEEIYDYITNNCT